MQITLVAELHAKENSDCCLLEIGLVSKTPILFSIPIYTQKSSYGYQ